MSVVITVADVLIVGVCLLFGYLGYRNGLYDGLLGLFGFYVCLTLSLILLRYVATFFHYVLELSPSMSIVMGFSFLFGLLMLLQVFFRQWVHSLIKMEVVDWFNRLTGSLLGLYRGLLLASLLALGFVLLPLPRLITGTEATSLLFSGTKFVLPVNYNYVRRLLPGLPSFEHSLAVTFRRLGGPDEQSAILMEQVTTRRLQQEGKATKP